MDSLTKDDLKTLLDAQGEWCISLYMPTVRAGAEVQQNLIRFKNLLRVAEERLLELGVRRPDANQFLAPAQRLLNNADFWRHQSEGLAVFLVGEQMVSFRLPVEFDELVVVSRRFHLKPLMTLLRGDGRFYVLALSQNEVRLLEGSRNVIEEVEIEDMPTSLAETLRPDYDPDVRFQFRVAARSRTDGPGDAIFHGQGTTGYEVEKEQVVRYFREVDKGIRDLLGDQRAPLILAGVEYLLPIYREVSSYPHLMDEGLTGNPESLTAKDIHERAWKLVEPLFNRDLDEQKALYHELAGRGDQLASTDLKEIVRAAHDGRIATLFVARDVQQWGRFSPNYTLHVHLDMQPGDQDLLDLAAVQTYLNGGRVYALEKSDIPGDGEPIAAIFRY